MYTEGGLSIREKSYTCTSRLPYIFSYRKHAIFVQTARSPSTIWNCTSNKQLWRVPTHQVKVHPGSKCPHLGYASFALFTAENAAAWSSRCLLLGPLPQLYFWHALFLCSAGMLLRRRGWSRRVSCRPSSHSFSWNIRTGIHFCLSQLLPLVITTQAQCLSACLPPRHPNSLWHIYRPRVVSIGFSQTKWEWCWEGVRERVELLIELSGRC